MPIIRSRSWVAAPIDEVFAFFDDPANLVRLMPPPAAIRPMRVHPTPPRAGTEIEFRYGIGPFQRAWLVRLLEHSVPERIVDETIAGPLKRFHHTHAFRRSSGGGTWIEDSVDFHVGPGGVAGVVVDFAAGMVMRAVLIWRQGRQRRLLRKGS